MIYVIKFISEAYTLQNNTTIDDQIISAGDLVVKAQYLCSMQENNNWHCYQQPLHQNIIFPTHIIPHQSIYVFEIKYVQDITKNVFNRIQLKKPYKDILFF